MSKRKKLEETIWHCIKKAEDLINLQNEIGRLYLEKAEKYYETIKRDGKEKEEIKMRIDSVAYAYSNPGEPIA